MPLRSILCNTDDRPSKCIFVPSMTDRIASSRSVHYANLYSWLSCIRRRILAENEKIRSVSYFQANGGISKRAFSAKQEIRELITS